MVARGVTMVTRGVTMVTRAVAIRATCVTISEPLKKHSVRWKVPS